MQVKLTTHRAVILQTSHGRRSIDVLQILCPERANWECKSTLSPSVFLPRSEELALHYKQLT